MPSRPTVDAFIRDVMTEDHVGAIERWYTEDASMQENQSAPRVGRKLLMDGERKNLARVSSVKTELLAPPLINGDTVVIRWRFVFTSLTGSKRSLEEVAWQTWRGEQIWRETFFYDPAQIDG